MKKQLLTVLFSILLLSPIGIKAADELYIGGDSIGIEVRYDGVMITGTYSFDIEGEAYDPSQDSIKTGDIIHMVNGVAIENMSQLYEEIAKFKNPSNLIPITMIRDGVSIDIHLRTIYNASENSFQSGLYIKDKIVGVGTLTFYDPSTKNFGALGHEIMDADLKEIANINKGFLYQAAVSSITKAQSNVPGEKHAIIDYNNVIGNVDKNTNIGIYGHYDEVSEHAILLPWAKKEEVHVGAAEIYTVLHDDKVETFQIEITKLHDQDTSSVKGIEFTINDEALLAKTNGVIQGMSGSPIVQDGRIIGAITHVITANPTTGYGVYIEWMLEEANRNPR